jgi:hypothetical protein
MAAWLHGEAARVSRTRDGTTTVIAADLIEVLRRL